MTLPEIFVQLPQEIQSALEKALEESELPQNPTPQQVSEAADEIVSKLKHDFHHAPESVYDLLDKLPAAITELLAG